MATLYEDKECVYLGDDPRVDDKFFGQSADVTITSDDLVVQWASGPRHSYPRSKLIACRSAHIEWEQFVSDDLQVKKSKQAVVCEFQAGEPERSDEPELPEDLSLQIGFRNKQFAKLFETRLKENTPLARP